MTTLKSQWLHLIKMCPRLWHGSVWAAERPLPAGTQGRGLSQQLFMDPWEFGQALPEATALLNLESTRRRAEEALLDPEPEWHSPCRRVGFCFRLMSSQVDTTEWLTEHLTARMTHCPRLPGPEGARGLQDFQFENRASPREARMSWSSHCLSQYRFSGTGVTLIRPAGRNKIYGELHMPSRPATPDKCLSSKFH